MKNNYLFKIREEGSHWTKDIEEFGKRMFIEGAKNQCEYYQIKDTKQCGGDFDCTNDCAIIKHAIEVYEQNFS